MDIFLYKSSSQIYSECMHDYLRLERYEKQLIGKEKKSQDTVIVHERPNGY